MAKLMVSLRSGGTGKDWQWIEVHKQRGFGLTSRSYHLMDLRGWAEERLYGLRFGVSVYRKTDDLWLPLTEVAFPSDPSLPVFVGGDPVCS